MDFYNVHTPLSADAGRLTGNLLQILPEALPLPGGHYARYAGAEAFPSTVTIARRQTLKRMLGRPPDLVAWTTANAIVSRSEKGELIQNPDQLAALLIKWEEQQGPTTGSDDQQDSRKP